MCVINGIKSTQLREAVKEGVLLGYPLLLTWGTAKTQPANYSQAMSKHAVASAPCLIITLLWL